MNKLVLFIIAFSSQYSAGQSVKIPAEKVSRQSKRIFYVLSVGVGRYQDKFWPDLKWPVKDARKVGAAFGQKTQYRVITKVLTNKQASRQNIEAALTTIAAKARPKDAVAVYISGHGTLGISPDGELQPIVVLSKTKANSLSASGLPQRTIRRWLDTVKARQKVLIFASCHSGIGKSRLTKDVQQLFAGRKGTLAPLEKVSRSTLVLAAAARGETARESDRLKGDIYTHFLLEALKTYDRNQDGQVSALEAHDYANDRAYQYTKGRQRATVEVKMIGDADPVLYGKRTASALPILQAYKQDYKGLEVEVGEGVKGKLPTALPLVEGDNLVKVFVEGENKPINVYRVTLSRGEVVTLEELVKPPPFGVQIDFSSQSWTDTRVKKIAGEKFDTNFSLAFFYEINHWRITAQYSPAVTGEAAIWDDLDSKLTHSYRTLGLGYHWSLPNKFSLVTQIGGGQDVFEWRLTDSITKNMIEKSFSGPLYFARVNLEYPFFRTLAVNFSFEHISSQADFANLGKLEAKRGVFGLGLLYKFGGRGAAL